MPPSPAPLCEHLANESHHLNQKKQVVPKTIQEKSQRRTGQAFGLEVKTTCLIRVPGFKPRLWFLLTQIPAGSDSTAPEPVLGSVRLERTAGRRAGQWLGVRGKDSSTGTAARTASPGTGGLGPLFLGGRRL